MEANELKSVLAAYDQKLEKQLHLNKAIINAINLEKPKKQRESVLISRVIEIVIFSLLALFLGSYIARNWESSHLAVSGIIVGIFTLIALAGSIGQVVLLQDIDFTKPIVNIRKKIEQVNAHGLLFIKLIFLSAPIWWAYVVVGADYFFNIDLYALIAPDFIVNYMVFNALLLVPVVWFLSKMNHKNLHRAWVRKTLAFFSDTKTMKALASLENIDRFEN